jgi:hypothetical protein
LRRSLRRRICAPDRAHGGGTSTTALHNAYQDDMQSSTSDAGQASEPLRVA